MLLPFSFCFCLLMVINCDENPHVNIIEGIVQGKILKTEEGREFYSFQAIPYAEPPLGELRFKSPVPKKPWEGVLDAREPHAICPQRDNFRKIDIVEGHEDCLYLNVYTPKLPSEDTSPLPVMVFIHGGGFYYGGGNSEYYGPEVLLDKNIVLVVPNYRLGALGFLSTGDEASPGNYGLKDQSLALKWVYRNIKYFNGDPDSVTLFGESAGGASVSYHMLSPLSRGLFKGVISQSGTAFCLWAYAPKGENVMNAKKLGKLVGCPTSTSQELVNCLRDIDPMVFANLDRNFTECGIDTLIPFKPVVEPPSSEAFLTDTPANLLKEGNFQDVPWIVGLNKDEGLFGTAGFIGNPRLFEEFEADFDNKAAVTLMYKPFAKNPELVSHKIRNFYFGNRNNSNFDNSFQGYTEMYSDAWFTKCIDDAVRIHLKVSKQPVYNYLFAHESSVSISQVIGAPGRVHGVCHCDELKHLFPVGNVYFPNKNVTEKDRKVTRLLTTLWENFARTGNPTPETDELITTKWEPIKSEKLEYLRIDGKKLEMEDALFKERVEFWRSLPLGSEKDGLKEEL